MISSKRAREKHAREDKEEPQSRVLLPLQGKISISKGYIPQSLALLFLHEQVAQVWCESEILLWSLAFLLGRQHRQPVMKQHGKTQSVVTCISNYRGRDTLKGLLSINNNNNKNRILSSLTMAREVVTFTFTVWILFVARQRKLLIRRHETTRILLYFNQDYAHI